MLLGFLLELAGGAPLDVQWRELELPLPLPVQYLLLPRRSLAREIAPTERDPRRGRLLQGEVHDENAAALGGAAGHAGLFGSVGAVGAFARLVMSTFRQPTQLGAPAPMREFADRSRVPGSSRALAWDTMLPTSSCGTLMSPTAIGHTGFTGTSLWIDEAEGSLRGVSHEPRASDAGERGADRTQAEAGTTPSWKICKLGAKPDSRTL